MDFDKAKASAKHTRALEQPSMEVAKLDDVLSRILPFVIISVFLVVCTVISIWGNVWLGSAGVGLALTTGLIAYLREVGHDETDADELDDEGK